MSVVIQSILKQLFAFLPAWLKATMKRRKDDSALRARHRAAFRHVVQVATEISTQCLSDIHSLKDWEQQRPLLRQKMLFMLGLDPFPQRFSLNARIVGVLERPEYRIEKLIFESLPGLFVTANFYLPRDRSSSLPCVIYLNGHLSSLDGAKSGHQDFYLWYPVNGFALLVIDPLGFGEIPGVHPGMNKLNQWQWISLGYTPAGVEVWNAMRAVDWLETRFEIDSSRIGVTGISGGGVMTQYLAALDERIAVAAPSCSTYTIGSQAAMGLVPQQCDCTFYPNIYEIDFPEVLALIAPRPLLILGGRKDPIFPPAGFREVFRRVRKIYDFYDVQGDSEPRIRLLESGEGHVDPPHFLRETRKLMCRWLRDRGDINSRVEHSALQPETPEALRCTKGVPSSALNYYIHDVWIKQSLFTLPSSCHEWLRRREELLCLLRSRVFGWFPREEIAFKTRRLISSGGGVGDFADFGEYEFDSESGVPVNVCLLTPRGTGAPWPLIVWVKGVSDHVMFPDFDEFFPVLRTHAVAILTPRFSEYSYLASEYAKIERTSLLSGRSVASMQVWDILRTIVWVKQDRALQLSEIAVYGRGNSGISGLYASLFDATINHVLLRNPPNTHIDGPAIPMILRDTDIEEVAALVAPRSLTLLAHRKDGFIFTQSIFQLMGAEQKFSYALSLPEALLGRFSEREELDERGCLLC